MGSLRMDLWRQTRRSAIVRAVERTLPARKLPVVRHPNRVPVPVPVRVNLPR